MKPKLVAILLLIVLVPLILLTWIGIRFAREEQEIVQHRIRQLLLGRLRDTEQLITSLVQERERELLRLTEGVSLSPSDVRELVRRSPIVRQVFVLQPDGERLHPPRGGPLSTSEQEFLQRSSQIWRDRHVFYQQAESTSPARSSMPERRSTPQTHGWYVWYWGDGGNLVFWRRVSSGHVIGVELNRMRLLADIVAVLPETDPIEPRLPHGRVSLVDSQGRMLYHWGGHEPAATESPRVTLSLPGPLSSWRLDYFVSAAEFGKALGSGAFISLVSGLVVVGIALLGLAVYFYRESSREMREAAQRISFVNHVSHELKTPLTNVRMYAELLENRLSDGDEKAAQYLSVITSESQRLSRLIGNVLMFARKQRDKLSPHPGPGNIDDTIASALEQFTPSLESKGVEVIFSRGAAAMVEFDADALGQIVYNLFGNVEKYAASGGLMEVTSQQEGEQTTITVADRGPGIPAEQRERIFEPFQRLSDKLTDGVAGTGIGLTIARELARLHDGDLTLMPSEAGACFRVVLRTPVAEEDERQ